VINTAGNFLVDPLFVYKKRNEKNGNEKTIGAIVTEEREEDKAI
tara:strand:- start:461 stop:592 length:132 start_codon:yes stop_codon:yes gene_type:complete